MTFGAVPRWLPALAPSHGSSSGSTGGREAAVPCSPRARRAPSRGSCSFRNPARPGAGTPRGPSGTWSQIYTAQGSSNCSPSDLHSIWDDNEVGNAEIQDSNKALTFMDLRVDLNHHLVGRRWVIYSSLSLGEQQHKGAHEHQG